jgi:hypothetical protein
MPLTRALRESWLVGSTILDLLDAHKWTGAELWKRPFRGMTFQTIPSNGARWRLIETICVLFAVLKRRLLQKRHRPPPEKTPGLNFNTATVYPHEYKNLHGNHRWANTINRKREKNNTFSQISRLETPEELQLHQNHEKFLFLTVLLLFAQCKIRHWWSVTWLQLTNFIFECFFYYMFRGRWNERKLAQSGGNVDFPWWALPSIFV